MIAARIANHLQPQRRAREWSQAELAARAGTSRAEVSAIETGRLIPSTTVALGLARALGCRVEDLFRFEEGERSRPAWAWPPPRDPCPFWRASVRGRLLLYPAEPLAVGSIGFDGRSGGGRLELQAPADPERTLVVAGCDPAVRLLESEYLRSSGFRLLALTRSSRSALELVRAGLAHAAGVHLGGASARGGNRKVVRQGLGSGYRLLRVARWEEGVALSPRLAIRSVKEAALAPLRWVGREAGSGARRCLERVLGEDAAAARAGRRIALDHRAVAQAISSGFAQAGVCLRLCAEEAGLSFLRVEEEDYDLCYPVDLEGDPRVAALVRTVKSAAYRRRLSALDGYEASSTGETQTVE